ncbi:glutathione S-transferase-like [Photinus pyralis]|uniref:glutathione S-transferase-like n=1 Tax=Photinus pyralis TaxID=7054 RepID=UPI0012672E21|nr:glutathione S-transferase-like [Photinus pyralis]
MTEAPQPEPGPESFKNNSTEIVRNRNLYFIFRQLVHKNLHQLSHPGAKATYRPIAKKFVWANSEKGKPEYTEIEAEDATPKRFKLTGANDIEDLEIDAVVDTVMDLKAKIVEYFYEEDAAVKERRRKPLFEEILPFYMKRMEAAAKKNKSHLAAGKLTWADVHFVGIVDYLSFMIGRDLLADCPSLQVLQKTVLKLPGIKEWVVKRPVTDY